MTYSLPISNTLISEIYSQYKTNISNEMNLEYFIAPYITDSTNAMSITDSTNAMSTPVFLKGDVDRWHDLQELMRDWPGTAMEKLVAIEKFVEAHS